MKFAYFNNKLSASLYFFNWFFIFYFCCSNSNRGVSKVFIFVSLEVIYSLSLSSLSVKVGTGLSLLEDNFSTKKEDSLLLFSYESYFLKLDNLYKNPNFSSPSLSWFSNIKVRSSSIRFA